MKLCLSCEQLFESEDWECPHCAHSPLRIKGHLAFAPQLATSDDGFDAGLFNKILDVENKNFWRKARIRLFSWAMTQYFPQAINFLEIGSGNGVILREFRNVFPQIDIWGMDIYIAGVDAIKKKIPNVNLFQADARSLPFRKEFDVIGAFDVLEHVDDDTSVFQEMYKAIKPGGGILVSVPQHPFLWSQRDECLHHKRRYTRHELLKKLNLSGFEVVRVTSFITFPFPLMVLSALKNRVPRENYDAYAECRISSAANKILDFGLFWEWQTIKSGVSFPFGGTLFVVGRRNNL
ncbi:MAG: class I SAM-dependent methyltransferase [bacterium]